VFSVNGIMDGLSGGKWRVQTVPRWLPSELINLGNNSILEQPEANDMIIDQ